MRIVFALFAVVWLCAVGCGGPATNTPAPPAAATNGGGPHGAASAEGSVDAAAATPEAAAPTTSDAAAATGDAGNSPLLPVAIEAGVVTLSPENTKIEFVGTHTGDKPDPRTGEFQKLTGTLQVDAAKKVLKAVAVEIDTTSLQTPIPKLTDHLKSPDFFEVNEHPTASFTSTKIETGEGPTQITGKLTLHGMTKEISFPATVTMSDAGLTLVSQFSIDRAEFGMDFGLDKIDNKVTLTVMVSEKPLTR